MSLVIECVLIDCSYLQRMSEFWQAALNLEHVWTGPSGGHLLAAREGPQPRLGLMPRAGEKRGKNRLHLDLRPDDQEVEVERLEQLGAVRVDVGQREVSWVVMADPEGNEFCVLRSRPLPTDPEPTQRQ
jgi:predicted enzyme related to lactoylglutathione lyase